MSSLKATFLKFYGRSMRAFSRAVRADSCGLARQNVKQGQDARLTGFAAYRAIIYAKRPGDTLTPEQRMVLAADSKMTVAEQRAYERMLELCGDTAWEAEKRASAERARGGRANIEASIDRHYRRQARKRG